jgi:hypothetical protein
MIKKMLLVACLVAGTCNANTLSWKASGVKSNTGSLLNSGVCYVFVGDSAFQNTVVNAAKNNNFSLVYNKIQGTSVSNSGNINGSKSYNVKSGTSISLFLIVFDTSYQTASRFVYSDLDTRTMSSSGQVTFSFVDGDFSSWASVPEPNTLSLILIGSLLMLRRKTVLTKLT